MVSSMTRKMISLAISLLVVVISLTGVALAATAPTTVTTLTRYTPGFSGTPGKMARDVVNNFYVADFWGKGIVKLGPKGDRLGFIPTQGRPTAVAVMPDSRLVVAMQAAPQARIAFYSQSGTELTQFGASTTPWYRPAGITVDRAGYVYALDAGDASWSLTSNVAKVRVYDSAGAFKKEFGVRNSSAPSISTIGGEFMQPMGIAYEKSGSGHIVVADTMNSRIQFFAPYDDVTKLLSYEKSIGASAGRTKGYPLVNASVLFAEPTEVAFEYLSDGLTLNRMYVIERARNEISVVDPGTNLDLMRINGTTVSNAAMNYPSGILFEKTTTGGVLYVSSAAAASPANVLPLSIDSGNIPTVMMTIDPVAPTVGAASLSISGSVTSGVNVTCTANGINSTTYTNSGSTNWNMALTLVPGANAIACSATDTSGTMYAQAATFYDSTLALTLAISTPADGSFTNSSAVTVTGTSNFTGVSIAIPGSTCAKTDANKNWSCLVNLTLEGSNPINVTASFPGTTPVMKSIAVVKDTTAPGVVISALSDGASTNNAVQNIDGMVTEKNLATVMVNGVPVPASAKVGMGTDTTYFSVPVTLVRGDNYLTVTATDSANNSTTTTSRKVKLLPENPGFTVNLPADNAYLPSASTVTSSGAADSGFTAVNAYPVAGGTWTGSLPLLAGFNGFKEYQFVSSGNPPNVAVKRTINVNAASDQLAITSPAADMSTNSASILIAGSIAAGSSVAPTISIDGGTAVTVSAYDSISGNFSHLVTLGSERLYTVQVATVNGTKAIRNIICDTTLPVMGIKADSRLMPATITGSIEGSARISAITASLSGTAVTIPLSVLTFDTSHAVDDSVIWTADLTSYAFDTISFTTTDPAGNSKTRVRSSVVPKGDIDGDGYVRLNDALLALRHSAKTETLTGNAFNQADVGSLIDGQASSDGIVNVIDAVLIMKKSYGLLNF